MANIATAAIAASANIRSGLRPILRPCKADIEALIRMHPLKSGFGSPARKATEARSLLIGHGPMVQTYPCWHPIRQFLSSLEARPALEGGSLLSNDYFDHGKMFQWAAVGWPYRNVDDLVSFRLQHAKELLRLGLEVEVVPSVLYNDGAAHVFILKVSPLIVRWYRGLTQTGWLPIVQEGFLRASIEYARVRNVECMEAYGPMQPDYFGTAKNHPGLHGTFHEAFDEEFRRLMEPWHYAFEYHLFETTYGCVESSAYSKLINEIGPDAPKLVADALIAARSI